MADRYFSSEPLEGPTATLAGSEAHHLLHVMRAQPGLELVLFDGHGGEHSAVVNQCHRSTVELDLGPRQDVERELPFSLSLAVGMPRDDRTRWLIEKGVEMGVNRFIPLRTERSVKNRENADKLARYVVEASKQCGRNRLMEVAASLTWSTWIAGETAECRVLAHPGGRAVLGSYCKMKGDVSLAVGPEGGFTEGEVKQAIEQGWQVVDLGERILRIETAAITLASAMTILRQLE